MKIRHFLLCLVVGLSLLAVGCSPARGGADHLLHGGRGEVSGHVGELAFCALAEIAPGGERVRVEYLSPPSLCGLVLTLEGSFCEVRVGGTVFTCSPGEVAGLLRPATVFLTNGDAKTVQREGENTVLTFSDGGRLTLSSKGEPLAFSRGDLFVSVVWWQSAN